MTEHIEIKLNHRCEFCDLGKEVVLLEKYTVDGSQYTLYECQTCKVQWWSPMKNPGAEWYENDFKSAHRNFDPILKPNVKHKDTIIFFDDRVGRVLDIGCGVGNFLALANKKGWECWGIDFDRDSVVTAHNTFGLENVEASDLTTFIKRNPSEKFDLVTFFDVFEHIDNHVEFLSQVQLLLKQDGYIALSVPYRHGWRYLMPHDLPPRHLTRWDDKSISSFLHRNGFTVKKVWKYPVSWHFLVMKMRWKYGRFATFGLVKKAKQKTYERTVSQKKQVLPARRPSIRILHALAKTKDFLLFGVPAAILWVVLRLTDKRHTDFYLVAQKNDDKK